MDKAKIGTNSWMEQFKEAMQVGEGTDLDSDYKPACMEYVMHVITLPFKLTFALVPPTEFLGGWACFFVALSFIGGVTCFIGDLASIFGCLIDWPDSITAITL